MRKILFVLAFATICSSPSLPSDPGQPLDCSDWVFLEPGILCSQLLPIDCQDNPWCQTGSTAVADNEGNLITLRAYEIGVPCGAGQLARTEIVRFDNTSSTESVVAYAEDRCVNGHAETIRPWSLQVTCGPDQCAGNPLITFDAQNGTLVIPLEHYDRPFATPRAWLASFSGFATTLEILQTYTPTSGPLSFRVPYMPEGFQHADYFDTYYGTLQTVGDWSQAQPLQCGYPTTAPNLGDYLTVADTLPTPSSGHGYYYVTAVTYQGETRYGRKCVNGVMSGRDPGMLPGCAR